MKKWVWIIIPVIIVAVCFYIFLGKKTTDNKDEVMLKTNIPYALRMNMSAGIRPQGIENKYGKPEITRVLDSQTYEIRTLEDGSKLFVIYNNKKNAVSDIWQLKKLLHKDDFKSITIGTSNLDDILNIDTYTTLTETSQTDAISEHRLLNNTALIINYKKNKDQWIVNDLSYLTPDPSGFSDILLPEDYEQIS